MILSAGPFFLCTVVINNNFFHRPKWPQRCKGGGLRSTTWKINISGCRKRWSISRTMKTHHQRRATAEQWWTSRSRVPGSVRVTDIADGKTWRISAIKSEFQLQTDALKLRLVGDLKHCTDDQFARLPDGVTPAEFRTRVIPRRVLWGSSQVCRIQPNCVRNTKKSGDFFNFYSIDFVQTMALFKD